MYTRSLLIALQRLRILTSGLTAVKYSILYIFTHDIYVLSDGAIMEWHNPVFVLQAEQ